MDIQALQDAIEKGDHAGFLRRYLILSRHGSDVSIPIHTVPVEIISDWQTILDQISPSYSDDFFDDLYHLWIKVLEKQGGKIGDNFVNEALHALDILTGQSPDLPLPHQSQHQEDVTSKISQRYQQDQQPTDVPDMTMQDGLQALKDAIKAQSAEDFLLAYLSFSVLGKKVRVPVQSLKPGIYDEWEYICRTKVKVNPDASFLQEITERWYLWIHQHEIPRTREDQMALYLSQKSSFETSPKPPMFIQRCARKIYEGLKWFLTRQ